MSRCKIAVGALASAILAWSVPALAQSPNYGAPLPDPHIPGYHFPEPENTVLGWVNNQPAQSPEIYLHGWGLWASLTAPSGMPAYGEANAPVYLTWLTKADLQKASTPKGPLLLATAAEKRGLALEETTQLLKFGIHSIGPKIQLKARPGAITPDTGTLETVAYDPEAASHILDAKLFQLATIQALYTAKQPETPAFDPKAVAVKPVYKVVRKTELYQGRYYVIPAWPGTPPEVTPAIEKNGYPETSWPGCLYVDTTNSGGTSASGTDPNCSGPTPATTYGLGDFVALPITKENVQQFQVANGVKKLVPGDMLLLVAMHVSSREITAWTWQTYFWTPNPKAPPLPSSTAIASTAPSQLTGAAAHYAETFAYDMVDPNQPVSGGTSTGLPVIGFNPYLEAGFPKSVFGLLRPITDPKTGKSWIGTVGIQTNCMTCHSLAAVTFAATSNPTAYGTDFYIGRTDSYFTNMVQTDFLWSIADVDSSQQQSSEKKTK